MSRRDGYQGRFTRHLPNWLYALLRCRDTGCNGIQCERWLHPGGEHR